ncbi:hypothetical protein BBJ28_00014833 [Nothophytophthora sp. Chile5]|nr:hypothetical protein BBJ28_00014833 [Nothophytophthora sp. Chile5]
MLKLHNLLCSSAEELLSALQEKIDLQAEYTSPSNDAESHGADPVCCQCYGYADKDSKVCKTITRGRQYCAGGDNYKAQLME